MNHIREKVKELKDKYNVNYIYFSKQLKMHQNSFYNFMSGTRELSEEKEEKLNQIVERLQNGL